MSEQKRRERASAFFRFLLRPFICRRFAYACDMISHVDGPYLLLSNHVTDLDPLFLSLAANRDLRFVASSHIMRKGLATWFIRRYFTPIIHTKGKLGLRTSMDILRALRRGESVALFPEGNRSFNGLTCRIPPVTGKLARSCGAALVTFRLEGGYFSQPRWGTSFRRGKIYGHLVGVYPPEQLRAMSEEDVSKLIRRDLHEDACAAQQQGSVAYTGKRPALGMEALLFTCPACGKIGTLSSSEEKIVCICGFSAHYTPQCSLRCSDGKDRTLIGWDEAQRDTLAHTVAASAPGTPLFSDEVTLTKIGAAHEVLAVTHGTLRALSDRFVLGERIFFPAEVSPAIRSRNTLVVHTGNEEAYYELSGKRSFCALKYIYLYQILTDEEII